MTQLKYYIQEALLPLGERPYYVTVSAEDADGYQVSIIKNKALEGRFVRSEDGTYQQIAGTCDYHLPTSADGMRKALRARYEEDKAEGMYEA
jgi:hypothetical protein